MDQIIKNSLQEHKEALEFLEVKAPDLKAIANLWIETLRNKGKIMFLGNGGSASDAQHLCGELVGRFKLNRKALPAITLGVNVPCATAISNDFGFQEVFAREIEALGLPQDLVVVFSTSGESKNVIAAVRKASQLGIKTIGFLGRNGGALNELVDVPFVIPINGTPRIQEMHIVAGHIICEIVEKKLFSKETETQSC